MYKTCTKGDLDKAKDYQQRALEIQENRSNPCSCCSSYNDIGLLYYDKGDLYKAKDITNEHRKFKRNSCNRPPNI